MIKEQYTLYPHQQEAVNTIVNNNGRGLLAIDVGGGKSLSSIAAIEELYKLGKAKNVLILVPAALQNNYINEIKKFSKNININQQVTSTKRVSLVTGDPNALTYNIVSYEKFRNAPIDYLSTTNGPIDSIIADEIGRAKTQDSKLAQSLINASSYVRNFIGLSATPTSNSPAEIIPILSSILGKDNMPIKNPKEFEKKFIRNMPVRGPDGKMTVEPRLINLKGLKELFGDSVFYFGKEEMAEQFPPTVENIIKVPMGGEQKKLYDYTMNSLDPLTRRKIEKGLPVNKKELKNILGMITSARQVSTSTQPMRTNKNIKDILKESPKLQKIVDDIKEHIKNTPNAKVMVYSNLVEGSTAPIVEALKSEGIPTGVFAGKSSKFKNIDRNEEVKKYLSGKNKVLALTPAGKEGLSLQGTTMEALVDPHWNPTVLEQSQARGVRIGDIGPDRKVIINKYISTLPPSIWQKLHLSKPKQSVEEFVDSISGRKNKLNKEFNQILKSITNKEPIKIQPVPAPPEISTSKIKRLLGKSGLEFKVRKRRLRSDKGRPRGAYRKRWLQGSFEEKQK